MRAVAVILVLTCLVATAVTKESESDFKNFIDEYGVCQGAMFKPMPGGWKLLTKSEIKKNKALQAHARADAKYIQTGCGGKAKYEKIQVACSQVVNGIKYQYGALADVSCAGKTRQTTYNGTFLIAAKGKLL